MLPTPCDTLIRCGLLVTQDAERAVLEDAALAVTGGRVAAAGPWEDTARNFSGSAFLDLSRCLVLPGLVNTHTHAAMTAFRGLADDLPLMDWLTGHIWPVETRLSPEVVYAGSRLACAELLASGCTCFADMYMFEHQTARACEEMGIRGVLGEGIFYGATCSYETPEQGLALVEDLTDSVAGSHLVRTAVAPHATYTNTPEILRMSWELAERLDLPWMIHAAESPAETAQCLEQSGKRPLEILADLGCLGPRSILVHMTDLTPEEVVLVGARGASVSHNPRSNMKLASGACPAQALLDAGAGLCLGTDGAGSNNALNLFAEMAAAALLQKVHRADPTALPAQAVLDAATLGGARALSWPGLGSLAPGGAADLAALDLDHPGLAPLFDPVSHAVYAATGAEVRLTMVAGRVAYEDGRFAGADPGDLADCARVLGNWALAG